MRDVAVQGVRFDLGGHNNRSFVVDVPDRKLFVKVCHSSEAQAIDRQCEFEHTKAAYNARLGPEPVHYDSQENVLFLSHIDRPVLKLAELSAPKGSQLLGRIIRRIHGVSPTHGHISTSSHRIQIYWERLGDSKDRERIKPFVSDLLQDLRVHFDPSDQVFCHNDLCHGHFLGSGDEVSVVDWENAGINDRYADFASYIHFQRLGVAAIEALFVGYGLASPNIAKLRCYLRATQLIELLWCLSMLQEGEHSSFYTAYRSHCLTALSRGYSLIPSGYRPQQNPAPNGVDHG